MAQINSYDVMIPFFGLKNDLRVQLFVHMLHEKFYAGQTNLEITGEEDEFNPDVNRSGSAVFIEWILFLTSALHRLSDKTNANFNDDTPFNLNGDRFILKNDIDPKVVIDTIMYVRHNSLYVQIIQNLLEYIHVGGNATNNVINNSQQWQNVTGFKFKQLVNPRYLNRIDDPSNNLLAMSKVKILNTMLNTSQLDYNTIDKFIKRYLPTEDLASLTNGTNDVKEWCNFVFKYPYKIFTYKISAEILKRIIKKDDQLKSALLDNDQDNFWANAVIFENTYVRSMADPDKIYKINKFGMPEDVTITKEIAKKLENEKCSGFKFKEKHNYKCGDFLLKCMSSDNSQINITQCKEYLQAPDFWDRAKEEILEMLPQQAQLILDSFGFLKVRSGIYDVYQSYGSWLQNIQDNMGTFGLDNIGYQKIAKNDKLRIYLQVIVDLFNRNLALLNKNYKEGSIKGEYPGAYGSPYLTSIGVKEKLYPKSSIGFTQSSVMGYSQNVSTYFNSLKNYTVDIANNANHTLLIHGHPVSSPNEIRVILRPSDAPSPSSPSDVFGMAGGRGILNVGSISDYSNKYEIKPQGPLLETLIKALDTKLSAAGKKFDPADKKLLFDHLQSFKETEIKLYKAITYVEKYLSIILNFQDYDPTGVINLTHLQKFVDLRDSYFNKSLKKSDSLLNIFQAIVSQIMNDPRQKQLHQQRQLQQPQQQQLHQPQQQQQQQQPQQNLQQQQQQQQPQQNLQQQQQQQLHQPQQQQQQQQPQQNLQQQQQQQQQRHQHELLLRQQEHSINGDDGDDGDDGVSELDDNTIPGQDFRQPATADTVPDDDNMFADL
jgi:hypothetical protein